MRRPAVLSVVIVVLCLIWRADVPFTLRADQAPASAAGAIAGRVIDAQSGSAIAGVVVALVSNSPPSASGPRAPEPRVVTDAQGRFAFRNLVKGSYQITATVGGNGFSPNGFLVSGSGFQIGAYLNGGLGQRRPNGPLQSIDLDDGARITDAEIRLWKPGAISGHLLDEADEPLIGQVVGVIQLSSDGRLLNGPTTRTDDRGAYRLGTLIPGSYIVFVPQTQISMPVSVGEAVAAAPPDPLASARFSATTAPPPTLGGLRVGSSVVSTTPDSGRYPSSVTISNALMPRQEGNALLVYPTTFFPAAMIASQAGKIAIGAGEERSGVDVRVRPVPTATVSGVLMDAAGPVPNFGIHLLPGDLNDEASVLEVAMTATDAKGAFTLPAVPRGQYTLVAVRSNGVPTGNARQPFATATRMSEEPGAFAVQSIAVADRPVTGVTVTVRGPVTVTGQVRFSGSTPPPAPERLANVAMTIWRSRSIFRSPDPAPGSTIDMSAGGRVFVRGLGPPGRFFVGLPFLPAPWAIESVTLGGRDITDTGFAIEDADLTDLVLTFTDRSATLSGTVSGDAGVSGADASVFLFPANRARWRDARLSARSFRVTRVSKSGSFSFGNTIPGDFLLAAVSDDLTADWPDEQLITRLSAIATPLKIAPGLPAAVALKASVLR